LQIVPYQAFQTSDEWLVLGIGNDAQWQRFCHVAGRADLAGDRRYTRNVDRVANRNALVPAIEALMREHTCSEWQRRLVQVEVPHAPVWNYEQLFASSQAEARGLRATIRNPDGKTVDLVASPFRIAGATLPGGEMPPSLGQHTNEVLHDLLGYDEKHVAELRSRGVI
jgi:formyl-CoA transferase